MNMRENIYDNDKFFQAYEQMNRSKYGLEAAGEWHLLQPMLGNLNGKRVLDLGCGYGWHCLYALEQGALGVVGVDLSTRMLDRARQLAEGLPLDYIQAPIEDIQFEDEAFDTILSSLALHYVSDFQSVSDKVYRFLTAGGSFVFSVEHPIFTAQGSQDWYYDEDGIRIHWPVDNYHAEGLRRPKFLGQEVVKYHRTLSTYINGLVQSGFTIESVEESHVTEEMLKENPGFKDENRRPMFLLVAARK